ncbi:MAG: pyridoxamine 5'-phosphate oxidase family protein [Dehalococcoidales bacterium]|nr:pyridoxamine 5'-phosphate oxidase family protein [Dehalococcoidales bacterium]
MAILSVEAKSAIAEIHPGLIATADASGKPNVSAKGTFRLLDDEHVLFADVNSPRTIANLLENPQVSTIVLDPATRRGCRIWGRAEVLDSGELFDGVNQGLAARNLQAKHVVLISVDDFAVF